MISILRAVLLAELMFTVMKSVLSRQQTVIHAFI